MSHGGPSPATLPFPVEFEPDVYQATFTIEGKAFTIRSEVWPLDLRDMADHPTHVTADGERAFTWYAISPSGQVVYPSAPSDSRFRVV